MLDFLCYHAVANVRMARSLRSTLMYVPEMDNNRAVLRRIGAHQRPVLVMWGSADGTTSRANVDGIVAMLPQAKLNILYGQRHAVMLTAPKEVNRQARPHLGTRRGRTAPQRQLARAGRPSVCRRALPPSPPAAPTPNQFESCQVVAFLGTGVDAP